MPRIDGSEISCGVDQLSNLTTPEEAVRAVALDDNWDRRDDARAAFVLFSDTARRGKGRRLAAYIKKNKLGTITATAQKINRNSGNKIQVWVWSIDYKALDRWEKNNPGRPRRRQERLDWAWNGNGW